MQFEEAYPEAADWLCAVFEDEALNAELSPTLLNTYLKRRLGYTDLKKDDKGDGEEGMKLIFEHNILEDGE